MYDQITQTTGRRRRSIRYCQAVNSRGRRRKTESQERVRLVQLAVCLVLFLTVFLWKGAFPQKLDRMRENILTLTSSDFDFQQALSNLGESLAGSGTALSDFGAFCVEVFGAQPEENQAQQTALTPPAPKGVLTEEVQFLSQNAAGVSSTAHFVNFSRFGLQQPQPPTDTAAEPEPAPPAQAPEEQIPAVPAAGTVVVPSDYSGEPLPDHYTMDMLSLGELETVTPVVGHLNSVYGYRDHPIDQHHQFHGGVDIGGQTGDPISAFAAGTVEYIGKDNSYGLYLQIDHGNGIKSFYAHCSKIVVKKGQPVALGEKVAEIGSSGSATGPHLHLELKYNKMHLNPAYYISFAEV